MGGTPTSIELMGALVRLPLLSVVHNPLPFSLDPRHYFHEAINYFNPFEYLSAMLRDLFSEEGKFVQYIIVHLPYSNDYTWLVRLSRINLNIAMIIAVIVTVVAFGISIVSFERRAFGVISLGYTMFLGIFGTVWFIFCTTMASTGHELTLWVWHAYLPQPAHDSTLMSLPAVTSIVNLAGLISALLWVLSLSLGLVLVVLSYWSLSIVIRLFGIIILAFLFVGPRAKNLCDWVISFAVVGMLLGSFIAMTTLELARFLVLRAPTGNWPIVSLFIYTIVVSLGLALDIALPWLLHKHVANVTGQFKSAVINEIRARTSAQVRGRVEAYNRKPLSTRLAGIGNFHEIINAQAVQYAGGPPAASHKANAVRTVLTEAIVAKAVQSSTGGVAGTATAAWDMIRKVRATRERTRRGHTKETDPKRGQTNDRG